MRTFLIVLMMTLASHAGAGIVDENFKLSTIAEVDVKLVDNATGACWTNLREVREYAEEKLRMKGANVVNLSEWSPLANKRKYRLAINVGSRRYFKDGSGNCVGSILIELFTYAQINEYYHQAIIGNAMFNDSDQANHNRSAIEALSEFIGELK